MVRWVVNNRRHGESFMARALAENFRSRLNQAARRGDAFDSQTGLPESMGALESGVTWYSHARDYADIKWPDAAGKTRVSTADALATVTAALVKDAPGGPETAVLRRALVGWAFNPNRRATPRPAEVESALVWVEKNSIPLKVLDDVQERTIATRAALAACSRKMDNSPAAATTARRKRAVFYNALGHAVERGQIRSNPVDAVQWKSKYVAEVVDRRVVASTGQVRQLLIGATYAGRVVGERLTAFFALLYFAALRPSEALALRIQDCDLPEAGWGRLLLEGSRPEVGKAWTDDGQRTEARSLKWRAKKEVRPVPIPPELVTILREHLRRYGAAADGRLFRTALGGHYARSAYSRAWEAARAYGLPPDVVASPVAARPYDLRHAGVTLWLNSGMPAPEVARRAGHSVDVLLKIYAGCIDGAEATANSRVESALSADIPPSDRAR
jgi:integrase